MARPFLSEPHMQRDDEDLSRYDDVWRASETYMRARKNDVHIPLSFAFARRLLEAYPEADRDVVLLALLLHDIGWWSIDMHDIIEKGFGPNMMQSDVRFLHEKEGVRLSREVLSKTGWPQGVIDAVAEIIDGHDTRAQAHSLNDRLVRDADKLWRFTVTGVAIACDWFKMTPHAYAARLEDQVKMLETEAGRGMAARELARTRGELMLHLI
jgi:HD superfamily phosphodiesterase